MSVRAMSIEPHSVRAESIAIGREVWASDKPIIDLHRNCRQHAAGDETVERGWPAPIAVENTIYLPRLEVLAQKRDLAVVQ